MEPRVKLYMPREESFPIQLKYIDVTRITRPSLDVLLEKKIDDYWNVDGGRELSDAWTGFTRFILLNERPPDGYTWSGERLTRKQLDIQARQCMARYLEAYVWCSEKESKTKMGYRETKARQSQTIERNILHWSKRRRIQTHNDSRSQKVGRPNANFIGKNWRKSPQGSGRKSETKKKSSKKQGMNAENFILRHWWISVISRSRSWNLSIKKLQRQGRTPRWHCQRWFWFVCSVHWTRIISISNDSRKCHGQYVKASRMFRTSSWCSIRLYSGQNGRCIFFFLKKKKIKVRMSRYLDTSTKAQMAKIMVQYGDLVVPLDRNLHSHPLAGLSWERQFEKAPLEHGWAKFWNWECLFVNRARGLFLSVYVDDIKLAGKTENINPTWKIRMKDVDLGEPTSFFNHVYEGCTQRECQISKDIVDIYRSMFESRISAWATEKMPETTATGKLDAETISSWFCHVECHAKKCLERCCEFANKTTEQLYKVATPCMDDHQFKEEETESVG